VAFMYAGADFPAMMDVVEKGFGEKGFEGRTNMGAFTVSKKPFRVKTDEGVNIGFKPEFSNTLMLEVRGNRLVSDKEIAAIQESLQLPTVSLEQFVASDFKGPVVLGGTGMIGSHWIETLARGGQRVAVPLRSQGPETHIANLRRAYDALKRDGLEGRLVLVDMGDRMDPRKMDQSGASYKVLSQLLSKASTIFQLAAQTSTRPEAVTKGSIEKESPEEFIIRTYVVNVFYTKLIARIAGELGIPMAYSSSQAIFALNPLFKEPMREPITEETPIPFDATTQGFMTELNKGFDDYVAKYARGDGSVTVTPEQFTRDLLEKTKIARLDNPSIRENLFQIVGEGMKAYRDAKAEEYDKLKQPLVDKALEDMAAKYPLILAFGNYAISKLLPEKDVLGLKQGNGIVFRFVNVFGKGMHPNNVLKNNLDDLMRLIQKKVSLTALHTTNVLREFMSALDLAGPSGALSLVLSKFLGRWFVKNTIIHVGTGQVISMEEALLQTAEAIGLDLRPVKDLIPMHYDKPHTQQPVVSYEKLKGLSPDAQPKMNVAQGLRKDYPELSQDEAIRGAVARARQELIAKRSELRKSAAAKAIPAAESIQGMKLPEMVPLAPGAARAETRMTAKIVDMMKDLGLESYGDKTRLVVPFNIDLIKQLRAENKTATIVVVTDNAATQAQARVDLRDFARMEVVMSADFTAVAQAQAQAFDLKLRAGDVSKSVVQIRGTGAAMLTADEIKAYALVGQMGGILAFLGFPQKVSFATEHTVADVLRSEFRAAEAIGKSA